MAENGEVWLVRLHPGGLEYPIAPREVAEIWIAAGWEARPLRTEELSERGHAQLGRYLDDLARFMRRRGEDELP